MSKLPTHQNNNSTWFWLAFIPVFGGIAIAYAGQKIKQNNLIWAGIGCVIASFLLSSSGIILVIWLSQIGLAVYLKQKFFLINKPIKENFTGRNLKYSSEKKQDKIDINTCSKDDLVYGLGLPIVYANDIEAVRHQGYIFTQIEELSDIAGLPQNYVQKIASLITFTYDLNQELEVSWRRLNAYSQHQLIECGIEQKTAEKIVEERDKNGSYQSVIEVQRRTGIPLSCYQHLI
ncbi:helix-hairpin-helix domain-containing protein [Crocosphaera sp. XPORK-15E]|uniref:helix-hairpin-helix domain-containing protein n=1 Tax=Crocosphaera sp. XPORK-15E TaxID=3110247 RepID=UPI002B1F3C06|nr:helix-hairpin-helix domain-containing protein [Crocosphaera sp. XPORK-15E]MEA5535908.1 helix-hairpin-helix domain-containing protein [Crocosphaera sp. XPORK-15E]